MTTMEKTDTTLPFTLKQERGEFAMEDTDDDTSFEDINDLLSISIPSLSAKKSCIPNDPNDEFLRLTTTVRAVYFSYLHKCLLANYILCYKEKNDDIPCEILKRCANELELLALRTSLEATIYRQNMLKLISDIKLYTSEKKAYKKLVIFLETPQSKVDIGVQTVNTWMELETVNNIQNITVSSNYEELSCTKHTPLEKEDGEGESYEVSTQSFECNNVISPVVNYISITETERDNYNSKLDEEEPNDKMVAKAEIMEGYGNIFQCAQDSSISQTVNQLVVQNEDENSQDSLLQHMEDMFCDSDDSSDLMTLIEKHSGVTKANIDKEISALLPQNSNDSSKKVESNNAAKINSRKISDTSGTGKYSFSYYKEMKSREANKSLSDVPDTLENKQKRRMSNIWFVERVYQVSKLKAKMTELSLKNYRRHGKVKEKFIQLFGESDDEEMMPDSPICIEEHLTACKERIAPWIVKRLMPFYKKRRIKDRQLFKIVAKHIADMLIIENTFPEQDCVNRYIETYFKNKKFIKTKQDVYL